MAKTKRRGNKEVDSECPVTKGKCAAQTVENTVDKDTPEDLPQFAQFRILPLTVLPVAVTTDPLSSFSYHAMPKTKPLPVFHHLFIRAHETRNGDSSFPKGRTLFVVNIPADASERHFARLFRRCGKIERVVWKDYIGQWSDVHPTGSQAHIVFENEGAVEKAIGMKKRKRVWSDELEQNDETAVMNDDTDDRKVEQPRIGLAKWLAQHFSSRPNLADLQREVDTSLVAFEDAEREARIAAERLRNVPDEDGFVKVVRGRGRRNTNMDGQGASVTAARPEEVKKLKPKKKELIDFYRFQMRETKRNRKWILNT